MRFAMPPMLRSSWNLIVEATIKQPSLVPAGSMIDTVAENQVRRGPWLLARVPAEPPTLTALDGRYAVARVKELHRIVNEPARRDAIRERLANPATLNSFERSLLAATCEWQPDGINVMGARLRSSAPTLKDLITQLKAPACTIARACAALSEWTLT